MTYEKKKISGAIREAKGKAKFMAGVASKDAKMMAEGQSEEVLGRIERGKGHVKEGRQLKEEKK